MCFLEACRAAPDLKAAFLVCVDRRQGSTDNLCQSFRTVIDKTKLSGDT
jgi:hypothetical protein